MEQSKNPIEISGNWENQKTKLKQKLLELTATDLNFDPGKKEEMLTRVQLKLGKTKEQLHSIINAL